MATTSPARVAAATVLYHPEPAVLRGLLGSLDAAGVPVFVFVNSALEAEVERLLAGSADIVVIQGAGNEGLGAGLNAAMARAADAGFSHVLLFDQDSSPDAALPGALLARMDSVAALQARPLAALGPRLTPPAGEGYKPIWYSQRSGILEQGVRPVDFLPTSGSLVGVAAWHAIGPFRADFHVDGIDLEWCFRAWRRGFAIGLADDLAMTHRWGQPGDGDGKPQILRQGPTRNYYYLRNAVFGLGLPHVPLRWKLRSAARLAIQAAILLARGSAADRRALGQALADAWRGRLGPIG